MTYTWPLGDAESQLEFVDLSHSWGLGQPCWPYFEDVKIERLHGMAKSRVLTQKITTVMHSGTHIDAPGHVVEGTPLLDEIPLSAFFGTGVVLDVPMGKWEKIMPEHLDRAAEKTPVREGDIVIVNTGWHHKYADSAEYYAYSPGFYKEAASGSYPKASRPWAPIPRHSIIHLPPPSARTDRPRLPAVYCPGPAGNSRRRPERKSPRNLRCGSPAIARSSPTASTASKTSAAISTR